ncbi:hypothetical protein LXL04_009653 [Taraxacum kok-saghyz]
MCEMVGPPRGILTPWKRDCWLADFIAAFKPSIAMIKRKGDRGSPWRTPLVIGNSLVGDPFVMTEAREDERQPLIQQIHFSLNPICLITDTKVVVRSLCHAFFGIAGSNNDVNVLDQSPIFNDMLSGKALDAPYVVNGTEYKFGYYITDDIYPPCGTIVKAFCRPTKPKEHLFTKRQEGARKDVECAFGVLKAKWHIVKNAGRPFELDKLRYFMYACIIMHNMASCGGEMSEHHIATTPQQTFFIPGAPYYLHRAVDTIEYTSDFEMIWQIIYTTIQMPRILSHFPIKTIMTMLRTKSKTAELVLINLDRIVDSHNFEPN